MARFSWLHFSDLHLGLNGSRLLRPDFREALERDLRKVHELSGPWDVVFLSGNLTESGNAREFTLLGSTLESLWDYFRSLGSTPRMVAVPGEQDFHRIASHRIASQKSDPLKRFSAAEAGEFTLRPLDDLLQRAVRGRFANFSKWFLHGPNPKPSLLREGLLPGDFVATEEAEGLKVGIIGFTAIFRSDPQGFWEISVEQIEAAAGGNLRKWALQHQVLVMVTYPPPAMLSPASLVVLQEKLAPVGQPVLHLCGGFSRPAWRQPPPESLGPSHGSMVVQARSLFGTTELDPLGWGYSAGKVSGSGLQLFTRMASVGEGLLTLGPASPDEQERTSDLPHVTLAQKMASAPAEESSATVFLQDGVGRLLKARDDVTQPDGLPEGMRLRRLLDGGRPVDGRLLRARDDVAQPDGLPSGIRLQRLLDVGNSKVYLIDWSPSGEELGLGLESGYLAYWKYGAEQPSWVTRAHPQILMDLAFSPNGETLASRIGDDIRLWDEKGTQLSFAIETQKFSGRALAWSSSGLLAADVSPGDLRIWDAQTGKLRERVSISLPRSSLSRLVWSLDGRALACGLGGVPSVAIWWSEIEQARFATVANGVLDIAWMPGTAFVALATLGSMIHIWDAETNTPVIQLEGHQGWVQGVSFSFDGRLLASQSVEGKVLLFRTDTWERVAEFQAGVSHVVGRQLAFSPKRHVLATASSKLNQVQLWDIDVDTLLKSRPASPTVHEVSAKVVLVGEGRAGKSSLALRLAEDRYEEMDSTHGMRFWPVQEERLGPVKAPPNLRRELILWDMGGQSEYQLVHQLFLRDSAVALMVMEPGRGERALEEIEGWNQRLLTQTGARDIRKLLVGAKLDTAASAENLPAIEALIQRCQFQGYLPTSAKTGQGIEELKAALAQAIDWNSLEKVSRPELFQRMRHQLKQLREDRRVVLTFTELERELRRELGSEFDPEVLRSVVGPLSRQGLVVDTRLADGTRVLVLEVEQVERYAGSLILAARDNPHGVPAIDVAKVLSPVMRFPRMPTEERLPRAQELLVLDCVIELLLEHGLCLRHEGLLIFPTLFQLTESEAGTDFSHAISLHYDFSGPIDNIYASLITSLALSRRFGAMRLGRDRAEFGRAGEDSSGVRRVKEGSQAARGHARLDVYFDPSTPQGTRELFVNIIEEHLREHGVTLMERLNITCVCGRVFPEDVVRERLSEGLTDVGCQKCDRRTPLTLGAQQARERDPGLAQRLHALRTDIQEQRSQNITETKVSMTEAKTVKPSQQTPLRILHLSDLHVGAGDDPVSLLQPLSAALRDSYEGLGLERLDYLVVSGDITNRASPAEFEKARELVSGIIEQFSLTAERCILVPGNHDLDWNTEVYRWEKKRQVDASRLKKDTFVPQGDGYLLRDDVKYPDRFKNFSQHFYHPLIQRPYPLEPEKQCLPALFAESRLQFLAMNSAWEVDEYFPERSSIFEQALSRGLTAADQELAQARGRGDLPKDARVLRLAVWHHPITGNEKILADAFMGRLQQADVRVCLHGHVHEDRADLVNYLQAQRRVHVVGAGSFGAPTHQRPESVPRLFNVLEVERDLKRIRVHTRALRKQGGAWEGWAVWPGEKPGDRRTFYEFDVP